MASNQKEECFVTRIVDVSSSDNDLGRFEDRETLNNWIPPPIQASNENLYLAARNLRSHECHMIPVAFPTETVFGLGADATNSDAVKGIYKVKGRPSDNPLIVHVCDLNMLREIIYPGYMEKVAQSLSAPDPIPEIYHQLIKCYWPGPLTIILPNSSNSKLAHEVTAGLSTFGARMPNSPLALSLIRLTGKPLAAPSANASTRPSPTTAHHVLQDLHGKIELIVNGGDEKCTIGVESTVIDGLCYPPAILRPGSVSKDAIRKFAGWEDVRNTYQDVQKTMYGLGAPRAPGMKYKHYSPKAKVILYNPKSLPFVQTVTISFLSSYEHDNIKDGSNQSNNFQFWKSDPWQMIRAEFYPRYNEHIHETSCDMNYNDQSNFPILPVRIGILRTKHWDSWAGLSDLKLISPCGLPSLGRIRSVQYLETTSINTELRKGELWLTPIQNSDDEPHHDKICETSSDQKIADVFEIALGTNAQQIAYRLFAAMRELDNQSVKVMLIEGIDDNGDLATAIMNRLTKAASIIK